MRNSYSRTRISILIAIVLCFTVSFESFAATAAEKRAQAREAAEKKAEATANFEEAERQANIIQGEIDTKQAEIDETLAEIEAKQAEIKRQQDALDDRLTAMYKTGTVGYVDVILSSQSITELISNIGNVQKILEHDQKLLTTLKEQKKALDELKTKLQAEQDELMIQEEELQALKDKYEAEAAEYAAQEEQLLREANELAWAASNYHPPGPISQAGYQSPIGNADGIITSPYGYRIHPIFGDWRFHNGLDICIRGGSYGKPVYAVGNGYVSMAEWYGGYGNCVTIALGDGYTALYGHLSGFNCYEGKYVSKGDVVGYIGSTGNSTGPHLHFTMFYNGSDFDPHNVIPGIDYPVYE